MTLRPQLAPAVQGRLPRDGRQQRVLSTRHLLTARMPATTHVYLLHGIGYDTLSLVHVRDIAYNKDPNSNITVAIHATQP